MSIRPRLFGYLLAPLLFLLAGCATGNGRGHAPSAAPSAGGLQLFLLAGQSNMAGRGYLEAQDTVPHERVWMLDRALAWVPAVDPVHFDKPVAGVGPGRAFGIAIAEADPEARVGLVPTAVGGSGITSWVPGGYDAATKTHPYDEALARARAAQRSGTFRAILWHQGESDSNAKDAPLYEARLRTLIARFRADLGDPDLPFLIGELGHFPARPWDEWRTMVDAAHRAVARDVPGVAYVSAEGLRDRGDNLHFSAESARELGRRYAAAYRRLVAK